MEDARASELVASLAQAAGERHPGALIDMRGTAADAFDELVEGVGPTRAIALLAEHAWADDAQLLEAVCTADVLRGASRERRSIGIFNHSLGTGGAERVTIDTARLWRAMGYQVTVICDEGCSCGVRLDDGISLVELPDSFGAWGAGYGPRGEALSGALRARGIDTLVFCQWTSSTLTWDYLITRLAGATFVSFTHGSSRVLTGYRVPDYLRLPAVYSHLDGVVCLSEEDELFWKNFNPRVCRVANLVDEGFFAGELPVLPGHRMLWVGRIAHDKTPLEAVDVLVRVLEEVPDATLAFAGPLGDLTLDELRARAGSEAAWNAITFLGDVPHERLAGVMREADLLLFSSHLEGYPVAFAEAKAVGLPIASYLLRGVTLMRGERGMLTAPVGDVDALAQAAVRLLTDKDLAHSMSAEARKHARELQEFDLAGAWREVFAAAAAPLDLQVGGTETLASMFFDARRYIVELDQRAAHAEQACEQVRHDLGCVESSVSFKAGRALTAPLRIARDRLSRGK